ncbi:DUF305 domain-containing protein [Micromonospora sp. WMMD710]|uniref:DUF305 domain-containing protein n=1 Tax=Micromonospora sp. WMMD710 TaxID=3016085 RepID=UPI0024171B69|nr:DUF305 domain-containing protein [Micromonospora sp. WMMD710]MDG4760560.1 DUF305 domain-containing protein [Micromonospora sp. WMMD710]
MTTRGPVRRIAGVVAALVVTALAVGLAQGWGGGDEPAAVPSAAPVSTTPVLLNGTDDAFIQLVIPMDEGLLALIDHLGTRPVGSDARLAARLGAVRAAHESELRELRGLLAAGNVPEQNVHEGHQMPGMVTDAHLAELRGVPDAEVWPRAVALLRAHLEQTMVLCRGEQSAGGSPELKALAGRIQQARAAELSALAEGT